MVPRLSRRQLLVGGFGLLGTAAAAGATGTYLSLRPDPEEHGGTSLGSVPVPAITDPSVRDAVAHTEWVHSAARGRQVRLVTVAPAGADPTTLPVVLALHGLRATAAWWSDIGNRRLLGSWFSHGGTPFALVAVDGGDSYWHAARPGDDPMGMLLTEVPGWLVDRRLGVADGVPDAVVGVSMGGAGALLYARERVRAARPPRAVATMSPGLFTDWRVARTRQFASEADWAAVDPLRFAGELAAVPTGVWCGDHDSFAGPTRRYIELAHPEVGAIEPGRHDGIFCARILPQVAAFLGRHLGGDAPRATGPMSPPPPGRPAAAFGGVTYTPRPVG